jgi:hypothetical protein
MIVIHTCRFQCPMVANSHYNVNKMRFFISASLLALCASSMIFQAPLHAQTRAIGGGALVLDDGAGHKVTVYAPSITANYQLKLPSSSAVGALVNDGSGNLTWAASSGGVSTFSAGTTGLTPSSATSGPVTLAGTLNAVNGGTGHNVYATGDILYANSTTTLARLPTGATNQVLGLSSGSPAWVTNGATITNATSTSTVAANQTPFTPTASTTYIRISNTSGGAINVDGINTAGVSDGRVVTIVNVSATPAETIMLKNQTLGGGMSVGEEFQLPGNTDILLGQLGAATFIYDATSGFWELVSTN